MESPEAEIIISGRSSSPTPVIVPTREDGRGGPGVCSLCLSGPGKYTCPRCNAPYCSLVCYKGPRHTACSELFYRDCVLQSLRENEAGGRGRQQMEEILLRLRKEAGEEEAAGGVMNGEEEAAGGVMNGEEAELWKILSAQEKAEFTRLIESGDIGALVPQWKPWWHPEGTRHEKILELPEEDKSRREMSNKAPDTNNPGHSPKARSISANTDDVSPGVHEQTSVVPPILSSIPTLCSLSRNPSPLVKYSVVSVIYGYAFSLLRHNGDVSDPDILLHFTEALFSVSSALSTNAVYNSTAHALKSAVRAASDPQLGGDRSLACSAMEAASQILHGDETKTYSLAALSHLFRLLGRVRKQVAGDKDIRKGAFNAKKKCLFLAAWVKENEDCLVVLSKEIKAEYRQYMDELSGVAEISRGLQKVWGGKRPREKKKLIQEIDPPTDEL